MDGIEKKCWLHGVTSDWQCLTPAWYYPNSPPLSSTWSLLGWTQCSPQSPSPPTLLCHINPHYAFAQDIKNFYLIISSREKQHLAIRSKVLVDSDTLVLVSLKIGDKSIFVSKSIITNLHQRTNLCGDHDVSLVEDKDGNLAQIKEPELETPVKHLNFEACSKRLPSPTTSPPCQGCR